MSEELRKRFAMNLRRLLEDDGKTQAGLARYMHVSTGTASEWVNGQKLPRVDKMEEIAEWLGVTIHDMIPSSNGSQIIISGMMVTDHLRHYQTQSCVFNPSKIKAFRSKKQSAAVSRCYLMCYLDK